LTTIVDRVNETPWYDEIVMPVLLAEARSTYARAIRRAFDDGGFDDIPRLGARLLGGIERYGSPGDLAGALGVSKQAASALADTLVVRGYLNRTVDEVDRRRVVLTLTDRGHEAATASARAVAEVDFRLVELIGRDAAMSLRASLGALVMLGAAGSADDGE
jgi:DNA-binding MarR family transcriptional regulator